MKNPAYMSETFIICLELYTGSNWFAKQIFINFFKIKIIIKIILCTIQTNTISIKKKNKKEIESIRLTEFLFFLHKKILA